MQVVTHAVPCARCGTCCQASVSAYVTDEDVRRWQQEQRQDILEVLARESAVWAGNHLVSAADGHRVGVCPFLELQGKRYACAIYPTRPSTCREYPPGSSEICPQYRRKRGVV